jgi:hypothetical protein
MSDAEMNTINPTNHFFHGEWNYAVTPKALVLE